MRLTESIRSSNENRVRVFDFVFDCSYQILVRLQRLGDLRRQIGIGHYLLATKKDLGFDFDVAEQDAEVNSIATIVIVIVAEAFVAVVCQVRRSPIVKLPRLGRTKELDVSLR